MNNSPNQYLKRIGVVAAFLTVSLSFSSAEAKDSTVSISAHVPVQCEANLTVNFAQTSATTFRIGSLNQFCNSRYEMTFTYAGAATGAVFRLSDKVIPVEPSQTQIEISARPVNASSEIYIANLEANLAEEIAASLNISMTPSGI